MCVLYGKEQFRHSAFISHFVFQGRQFLCFCECSLNKGTAPFTAPTYMWVSFLTIAVYVRASLQGVNESHGGLRTPLPSAESMTVRDCPISPETSCRSASAHHYRNSSASCIKTLFWSIGLFPEAKSMTFCGIIIKVTIFLKSLGQVGKRHHCYGLPVLRVKNNKQ